MEAGSRRFSQKQLDTLFPCVTCSCAKTWLQTPCPSWVGLATGSALQTCRYSKAWAAVPGQEAAAPGQGRRQEGGCRDAPWCLPDEQRKTNAEKR